MLIRSTVGFLSLHTLNRSFVALPKNISAFLCNFRINSRPRESSIVILNLKSTGFYKLYAKLLTPHFWVLLGQVTLPIVLPTTKRPSFLINWLHFQTSFSISLSMHENKYQPRGCAFIYLNVQLQRLYHTQPFVLFETVTKMLNFFAKRG